MKEKILVKMGAVLIFIGILCITPVIAVMDPILTGKSTGQFGETDMFISDKLSALSDLKSKSGYEKPAIISEISHSLKPEMDISSLKNIPIEWNPEFMYYAQRNANRIPRCHF